MSSEVFPLAKTGGLADFSWGLARALAGHGCDIRILMPAYPKALEQIRDDAVIEEILILPGECGTAALWAGRLPGTDVPVWLLDCPNLFDRPGTLYQDPSGKDWPDNGVRFGALAHAAAAIARGALEPRWKPDVLHLNDWQAGLTAPMLRLDPGPGTPPSILFTIHNMAFQGLFEPEILPRIDLPYDLFTPSGIEYHGQVSFLKAGLQYSDRLVTVSLTYAREILTPEFGFGLDGLLRERVGRLQGIRNGIDAQVWDPANDGVISKPYALDCLAGKRHCKSDLRQLFGLNPDDARPVFAFVSRLTHQKFADALPSLIPFLVDRGAQVAVHGQGDRRIESQLEDLGARLTGSASVRVGYSEETAHRLIAGADVLLAPSRFEPCGLTQMYAMRYGTLPIVTRVGGLAETVTDATPTALGLGTATGFIAGEATTDGIMGAADRCLTLYDDAVLWNTAQRGGMSEDFSWEASAARYLDLYRDMAGLGQTQESPYHSIWS